MILYVNMASHHLYQTNKKQLLFKKMNGKMVLSLFGDENFQTLKLPSVIDMNGDHFVKLARNPQRKVLFMNIYGGEEFVNQEENKSEFLVTK